MTLETESVSEGLGSSEDIVCNFDFDGKNKISINPLESWSPSV